MYTRYQYHWCWLISATHREKKEKTRKSILHLFEWHFIPHTLSPEGKILAVHASRSTVSGMHLHLLQAPTRSLILLPIGWWSEACAVSKDERPHRSIHLDQTDQIDRSIAHKASDVASSSLPTACMQRIIIPGWLFISLPCIILRTSTITGACKKCPSY